MAQYAFDCISTHDLAEILSRYPDTVTSKLADLEEQRFTTIPAVLAERRSADHAYLTKAEVATLVDWKLYVPGLPGNRSVPVHVSLLSNLSCRLIRYSSHGTFRPSLKGLVQQNSEDFVNEITTAGFSANSWNEGLNILTRLRGIGPATAALLLSTSDPEHLPFFSDELFRWAFWQNKTGARWDRKIKYSLKEYRELKEKVDELRNRLGRGAVELEKAAYVLGKTGIDLGASEKTEQIQQKVDADDQPPCTQISNKAETVSASSKRKVAQATPPKADSKSEKPSKRQKTATSSTSQRATRSSGRTVV
jgi:hypothetical protein